MVSVLVFGLVPSTPLVLEVEQGVYEACAQVGLQAAVPRLGLLGCLVCGDSSGCCTDGCLAIEDCCSR